MYCPHIGPTAKGAFRVIHPLAGISRGRRVVLGPAALRFVQQTADRKFCTVCIEQAVADVTITIGRKPRVVLVMNANHRLPPVVAPKIIFEPLPPAKAAAKPAPSFWRRVAEFFCGLTAACRTAFGRVPRRQRI